MANAVTSRTGKVSANVVSYPVPGKQSGVHMYLKYNKGDGTQVSIALTFIDPHLDPTDEYQEVYYGALMVPTVHAYVFTASGNYRIPIPMALGEKTIKATITFADGTSQTLVLDFRTE